MDITNKKLTNNELRKAGLLLIKAAELGMDCSGYGQLDVNYNSGNVYLWLEDYQFTLYISLGSDSVWAVWSNPYDGEEGETDTEGKTLNELEEWAASLSDEAEEASE